MSFIEVRNLYKSYLSGGVKTEVLKNVNLKINKGEFIAVVGTSGSGKSTLLNIIGLIDKGTKGKIYIDGIEINNLTDDKISDFRLRNIGVVFQSFNLIEMLNVEENIDMPILIDDGVIDKEYKEELLNILGITNKREKFPYQLSGGEQQRVAIGRALINKPSILLADEPTGSLDSKSASDVMELIRYVKRKYNQTVILITHDDKIAKGADRVIRIKDGEIYEEI